jgi:POT family proton-dependent oligopeptide transporter
LSLLLKWLPVLTLPRLHQELNAPDGSNKATDLAGGPLQDTAHSQITHSAVIPEMNEKAATHGSATPPEKEIVHDDDDGLTGERPTEEEKRTLRHIGEPIPKAAFLVAIVELCERFTYYGASGIFQNYVQKPLDGSEGRGALGMGHMGATGLTTFFQFWCYGSFSSFSYLDSY